MEVFDGKQMWTGSQEMCLREVTGRSEIVARHRRWHGVSAGPEAGELHEGGSGATLKCLSLFILRDSEAIRSLKHRLELL